MSKQLHLLRRPEEQRPNPLGADVLALAVDHDIRVVELFDAPIHVAVLDLTLSERDMPELVTAMHWAEEIHSHHVAPQHVLAALPYVRPEALKSTTLVLHGPWIVPTRPAGAGARLTQWPGPVKMHRPPSDHGFSAPLAEVVELAPTLDPFRANVLPRACGAVPPTLEDGRRVAMVGISADVPEEQRNELHHVLPTLDSPQVAIEVVDETKVPLLERGEVRRCLQAYIVPEFGESGWSSRFVEAVAQQVPIISLGEPTAEAPDDVVFARGDDGVDRSGAVLRSWCQHWANGNAAPLNPEGRRAWLQAAGVPTGP